MDGTSDLNGFHRGLESPFILKVVEGEHELNSRFVAGSPWQPMEKGV